MAPALRNEAAQFVGILGVQRAADPRLDAAIPEPNAESCRQLRALHVPGLQAKYFGRIVTDTGVVSTLGSKLRYGSYAVPAMAGVECVATIGGWAHGAWHCEPS